jgi:crotonobetainyl-CoA:carnitine CoA-transferase CaiB-like acyl-CoA transferase
MRFGRRTPTTSPHAAWAQLLDVAGREPDELAEARTRVRFAGSDPVLPSRFLLGTAGAAALAALGTAVDDLWRMRGGAALDIGVDLAHAGAALRSSSYLRIDGAPPPSPWDPIAGFYPTGDGRFIQLHTNFPHHRDGTCAVLGVPAERAAVAAAIANRTALALEDELAAAGLCATVARTPAEWASHAQARAVAALPLLEIERVGDADPEPLARRPPRPLSGVRVLDLTRVLAGPTAGRSLAEHGAEVLALCSPALPNLPALMLDTNHGKYSAHLDLADAGQHAHLRALVGGCDVFLQAYRPGALAARGFGVADLARLRPGIVCVDLSAWGHAGPWAQRRGYDTLVQSASGIAVEQAAAEQSAVEKGATGVGAQAPKHLPCSALDYLTGYLAAFGALVALGRRSLEGGSWHVRVSLAQTARWLDALGRVEARTPVAGLEPDVGAAMLEGDSPAGRLRFLAPALRLGGAPAGWDFAAVPAGTHAAAWRS